MLKRKSRIAAAVLALCGVEQAQAQSTGIVECRWDSGGVETLRITPSGWETFDTRSWSWGPVPCNISTSVRALIDDNAMAPPACVTRITDQGYERKQEASGFYSIGSAAGMVTFFEQYYLDRTTGRITFELDDVHEFNGKDFSQKASWGGTCNAAPDPALKPRPGPRM